MCSMVMVWWIYPNSCEVEQLLSFDMASFDRVQLLSTYTCFNQSISELSRGQPSTNYLDFVHTPPRKCRNGSSVVTQNKWTCRWCYQVQNKQFGFPQCSHRLHWTGSHIGSSGQLIQVPVDRLTQAALDIHYEGYKSHVNNYIDGLWLKKWDECTVEQSGTQLSFLTYTYGIPALYSLLPNEW